MSKDELQKHLDSFTSVPDLWKHLYVTHYIDSAGQQFIMLDALHLEAHRKEESK